MLFERHARTIYNFCFRRVGNWATCRGSRLDRLPRGLAATGQAASEGKELPWLFGIATNVVRNRRRAERRHAAALRRVPQPSPEPSFADDSDERVDDEELMGRALGLVARLPRREQEVFALCAWSELSYEDAAVALRIPVGTVRSRLSRARARLQELDPGIGHEGERMQGSRKPSNHEGRRFDSAASRPAAPPVGQRRAPPHLRDRSAALATAASPAWVALRSLRRLSSSSSGTASAIGSVRDLHPRSGLPRPAARRSDAKLPGERRARPPLAGGGARRTRKADSSRPSSASGCTPTVE